MAVIKIKNIRTNLQAVIKYAKNGDKTDYGILVSSINCSVENSYEEMALTKKFFHKEDKILGYHIIQSFKGNEVSPEEANQIGKELAEELWGDKYQVIICTHINKDNVHNHIILNSVSFIDGNKYHNSKAEIAFMKDASDILCLNYGLSIVNTPKGNKEKEYRQKNIDYFNRRDENEPNNTCSERTQEKSVVRAENMQYRKRYCRAESHSEIIAYSVVPNPLVTSCRSKYIYRHRTVRYRYDTEDKTVQGTGNGKQHNPARQQVHAEKKSKRRIKKHLHRVARQSVDKESGERADNKSRYRIKRQHDTNFGV